MAIASLNCSIASSMRPRLSHQDRAQIVVGQAVSRGAGQSVPPQGIAVAPGGRLTPRSGRQDRHHKGDKRRRKSSGDWAKTRPSGRRPKSTQCTARSGASTCSGRLGLMPTCTRPIIGTSVPRYQNQPTSKQGRRPRATITTAETPANTTARSFPNLPGPAWVGIGPHKSTGRNDWPT